MTQHPRIIFTGQADGWMLTITVRAALDRWIMKFDYTKSLQLKTRTGAWLHPGRWDPTQYGPESGSEARTIAETWLRNHPVPAPGAAGVAP